MDMIFRAVSFSIPTLASMIGVLFILRKQWQSNPKTIIMVALSAAFILLSAVSDGAVAAIGAGNETPTMYALAMLFLYAKPVYSVLMWYIQKDSILELYISLVICGVFWLGSVSLVIIDPQMISVNMTRAVLIRLMYRLSVLLAGGICLSAWLRLFRQRKQRGLRTDLMLFFIVTMVMACLLDFYDEAAPNFCLFIGTASVVYYLNHLYRQSERKLEEIQKSQHAELMASQIQPHFLFNALNAIYELCGRDPKAAQAAIDDFATYLRLNLRRLGGYMVPFSDEMMHVDAYLRIEEMRFGSRLHVVRNIQEENFLLPPLTMEPLVENAVRHGICKKEEGGTVYLYSRRLPDGIEVVVEDDGVGFDMSEIIDEKEHVGIVNVRQRLQTMAHGELTITSTPGKGTRAVIRL